jgi:Rrf2 family protein
MFSKACEYGIRASIYITLQSLQNVRVSLKDIAKEIDSPEAFTAKILQQLAKNKIIDSVKGPTGGFDIDKKKIEKITLSEIVRAIDGDSIYDGCGLGLKKCSEKHPCPVHHKFKKIREDLKKMLDTTTLYELSLGLKNGITFLKH